MTTEQEAREALEVLWNDTDPSAINLAHETLQSLITQTAEDKRIADAVRGGVRVRWSHDSGIAAAHLYGQDVLIIPASVLEEPTNDN